ncbi:hypothetical protein [Sulfobacillus sp. hq2]|uniref:hypothetical protein n=1 Tax=Sulfobacillus sp. hq2 TaxID=2039167 RepID=UPI000CD0D65F|nr:hypothetical protein [Sulfobacillus sp. hq2]POB12170.1 hypothetical protein CO251_00660 [Sulfobacillus sp. hq2]
MSRSLTQAAAILGEVAEQADCAPGEVLALWRTPSTPFAQAAMVEDVARATLTELARAGVPLPDVERTFVLARPYDDGTARLVISHGPQILFHDEWPASGSLRAWYRAITDLVAALRAVAAPRPVAGAVEDPLVHVYGPDAPHAPVTVVANRAGLAAVAQALAHALLHGEGAAFAFTADGEGFDVVVQCDDTAWDGPTWRQRPLPYRDSRFSAGTPPRM